MHFWVHFAQSCAKPVVEIDTKLTYNMQPTTMIRHIGLVTFYNNIVGEENRTRHLITFAF